MKPKVYFSEKIDESGIRQVFKMALSDMKYHLGPDERVAVKVHFGEKGNSRFVSADRVKMIVDELKKTNAKDIFLTDANTLYMGMRGNATNHLKVAEEHGFMKVGVPVRIADGEHGDREEKVRVDLPTFKEVMIAQDIAKSSAIAVISHFKGHMLFGFGGALKNLGMGSGSRAGKLQMHSKIHPTINDSCVGCGLCVEACAAEAITIKGKKASIEKDLCTGCAKCIATCPNQAVNIPWHGATTDEAQERCAEYALGAALGKKCIYITFINNITKDCDCMKDTKIIGHDVGVVASVDPVAVDSAAYDLVIAKHGKKDIFMDAGNPDGTHILDYSEEIGLGKRAYELVRI